VQIIGTDKPYLVAACESPCYLGALEPAAADNLSFLSNITIVRCHGIFSLKSLICIFCLLIPLPQFCRAQDQPPATLSDQHYERADLPRPDFKIRPNRPNSPVLGEYDLTSDTQTKDGTTYHLHGKVVIEGRVMVLKADEVDLDEDTHIATARGHVYFQHFERNEIIVCAEAEYNTETETGKFYDLRGYTKTKVDTRPGMLTSDSPFYFEGKWAERIHEKYILHDGMITGCLMPNPWWTLRGPKFDIIPEDRALAYKAVYRIKKVPLFYTPFFYKSLKKEPRKSGFLIPNLGHSSTRGYMVGLGYYWAINRSYDVTYRFQDFTERGYAHHLDFRGKPTQGSDFDVIFYGLQDRGTLINNVLTKQGGYSIYATGKADLGGGWTGRVNINYVSSLTFRQTFTESFNEAIFSESFSTGYVSKHFSYYTINFVFSRIQNFQDTTPGNDILIRKLPEVQFFGRDRQIAQGPIPLWFSFTSTAGLMYRSEPATSTENSYATQQFSQRASVAPRVMTAFHWQGFHLIPSFTFHETIYNEQLENGRVVTNPLNVAAPEFGLDFVMPMISRVFKKKTIFGDSLKHVIEPRATYRYVTGVNNYNAVIRFDQLDLLSNTNELELSVINRIYAKRGNDINEIFTWEVYQKRFFDPTFGGAIIAGQRNVIQSTVDLTGYTFLDQPRSYSPIVSVMRIPIRWGMSGQWRADYDPLYGRLVNSSFSLDLRQKKYFVSLGQNQVHSNPVLTPSANQVRGVIGYGDANRKGFNGAVTAIYDYTSNLIQFATATMNYNTDCCGFSVQYRRFDFGTRNENQFRVSFSIANVGSFGTLKKQERLF
jgi:LPS-assembly protein